jgi:hypothetical protein
VKAKSMKETEKMALTDFSFLHQQIAKKGNHMAQYVFMQLFPLLSLF